MEDDVDVEMKLPEILTNAFHNLPDDWAVMYVGHCKEEFAFHTGKVGHRCVALYRLQITANASIHQGATTGCLRNTTRLAT